MLIINTTFFVVDAQLDFFLQWINEKYVPRMKNLEHFSTHRLCKILSQPEPGTCSFSLQFELTDPKAYRQWENIHQRELQQELKLIFGENVLSFSTLLEQMQ